MKRVEDKGKLVKLPPDTDIRLKLVDYIFGGLTAQEFIEWLKNYESKGTQRD